jgi:hypothetical protein
LVSDAFSGSRLLEVDLTTGDRSVVASSDQSVGFSFGTIRGMAYDQVNDRHVIFDSGNQSVHAVNAGTSVGVTISDKDIHGGGIVGFRRGVFNSATNVGYLVGTPFGITTVNLADGVRSLVGGSSSSLPYTSGDLDGDGLSFYGISGNIHKVSLSTGDRQLLIDRALLGGGTINSVTYDAFSSRLLFTLNSSTLYSASDGQSTVTELFRELQNNSWSISVGNLVPTADPGLVVIGSSSFGLNLVDTVTGQKAIFSR